MAKTAKCTKLSDFKRQNDEFGKDCLEKNKDKVHYTFAPLEQLMQMLSLIPWLLQNDVYKKIILGKKL